MREARARGGRRSFMIVYGVKERVLMSGWVNKQAAREMWSPCRSRVVAVVLAKLIVAGVSQFSFSALTLAYIIFSSRDLVSLSFSRSLSLRQRKKKWEKSFGLQYLATKFKLHNLTRKWYAWNWKELSDALLGDCLSTFFYSSGRLRLFSKFFMGALFFHTLLFMLHESSFFLFCLILFYVISHFWRMKFVFSTLFFADVQCSTF